VPVENSRFFSDGFGIVGGDSIRVGAGEVAVVNVPDESSITIDSAIVWSDAAPVSLSHRGNAPDMGAYEYGEGPPNIPLVTDDGSATSSAYLHAAWTSGGPSGIAWYRYRIVNGSGIPVTEGHFDGWEYIITSETSHEVTEPGLLLIEGETYFFEVQAKNVLGLWSQIGRSDGITIEGGPSTLPCGPVPAVVCRAAAPGKAKVMLRDSSKDSKDQLQFKWSKGDETAMTDFGDPVAGDAEYALCIYDGSVDPQPLVKADLAGGGTCGGKPCWKESSHGYRYKGKPDAAPDGITNLTLRAGAYGKSQVKLKAKGPNLSLPTTPLTLPVTVQLVAVDGSTAECWQTVFANANKNEDGRLKAKGP
jgi:hypothetical protein